MNYDLKYNRFFIISISAFLLNCFCANAQTDTLSKFDRFNKKAEELFRILPVPMYSYSSEAGNIFGIAKYNIFKMSSADTVSYPSKISGVMSFSTKGRINASVANELLFKQNAYMITSFINYKKQPEYILGIGNNVKRADVEQIEQERFVFSSTALRRVKGKLYAGVIINVASYFNIKTDTNSFLIKNNIEGIHGGTSVGLGLASVLETRDNRYNPSKGEFIEAGYSCNFGTHGFSEFHVDARKYFTPFKNKMVLAVQATTTSTSGEVPFYELSMLGGDSRMRGYYQGALRDKTAVDAQVELRVPVWNIFGLATFVGVGQVAEKYSKLVLNECWWSYGGGVRIRVDSKNNTNLRFDMGFGPQGISGFYVNFAEAF